MKAGLHVDVKIKHPADEKAVFFETEVKVIIRDWEPGGPQENIKE